MKIRAFLKFTSAAILCASLAGVAQAQATRTWISGVGDDANPCSRTAPCKTWVGAFSKTAPNGEINVLDPGGFGPITINKSITLDGGGTFASILGAGTNGINVTAGVNDVVTIRNISINGTGGSGAAGTNGIRYISGKQLNVENCRIFNFTGSPGRGIIVNGISGAIMNLFVTDTIIANNADAGIAVVPQSGSLNATVEVNRSIIKAEGAAADGIFVGDGGKMVVRDSVVTSVGSAAVEAGGSGAGGNIVVENSELSFSSVGARTSGTGVITLSSTLVTGNTSNGLVIGGGQIRTLGNNRIFGNAGNNGAGLTTIGGLQ